MIKGILTSMSVSGNYDQMEAGVGIGDNIAYFIKFVP